MSIILDGAFESMTTRQDGSLKLVFGTQELPGTIIGRIMDYRKKHLKLLISDENIDQSVASEVEKLQLTAPGNKSSSKRLRDIIFIKWQKTVTNVNFDSFYEGEMNSIILRELESIPKC